ncbi:MAG TPA: dihydroorotase [Cyanobacteria bacterium UBA11049]|nr:dihydroorotase [Cyanobacteria bacterium UBA11049]
MTSELLKQVRVIDPVSGSDRSSWDVLIADGVIKAVAQQISDYSADTQIKDCRGLVLGPGLVDLYSHSGEPGFEERETLATLFAAATAGGFTRLNILPDTTPPLDNPAGLVRLQQKGLEARGWGLGRERDKKDKLNKEETAWVSPPFLPQLSFWGAITQGVQGQQMTELAELAATSGVIGFADGQPLENLALLRRVLEYLKPLGKPLALYPCSRELVGNGVMREGSYSIRFGLPGNPAIAQTTALASILELVAAIGTPVHIMRVSTARSVELIQAAKARGLPITASTTWMHLLLDTRAVSSYNTSLRIEPPLGNPKDLVALRQGLRVGILDAIAIDHSPYAYEEKTVAFAEAPAGAIGLELALPLLWQHLVEESDFSALELWRCLSTRASECLQHTPKPIAPGEPANLTLFSPQQPWTVEKQTLQSLSTNTPWLGQQVNGRVVKTWLSE